MNRTLLRTGLSLLRRRRARRTVILAGVALVVLAVVTDRVTAPPSGRSADDFTNFHQQNAEITRVTDGDTVHIETDAGVTAKVRLIGIDAPETDAFYGSEATAELARLVDGSEVVVTLERPATRDRYERLLAHVWVDEREPVSRTMIDLGAAYAYRPIEHERTGEFEAAERAAQRDEAGLWQEVTRAQQPEWRRRWLDERVRGDAR